jgi:hypothetical protein
VSDAPTGFTIDAREFLAGLAAYKEKATTAVGIALFFEATDIMENPNGARDQAPVDTTALRESGKVLPAAFEPDGVTVTLGFGDSAIKYAHRQHEELEWHHPKHGKAKYLEDPIDAAKDGFLDRIATRVKGYLGL